MSKGIILKASVFVIAVAIGGCEKPRHGNLLDGCYYLDEVPILTLQGTEGRLLIPGDISRFRLIPRGSSGYIWMTTQSSFVIGGSDEKFVKSAEGLSSPLVVIDDESPAASRILVRDNGQTRRLVRKNSCGGISDSKSLASP